MTEEITIQANKSVDALFKSTALSYVPFSTSIFGRDPKFVVTAGEDYLHDYDIHEGDTLLCRRQEDADYGQIVCALVDDNLCLRFYSYDAEKDAPCLKSANPEIPDVYGFTIIGTVAWVIRKFDNQEVLAS